MAELVIGPATEVGKCIAEPIKRQFNYLCCFNTNIQNLRDESKRLDDAKEGLQRQVEVARRNVQVIMPRVETWQDDVSKIQADMTRVETEILHVKSRCLAIMPRFSLSRKAKKMAEAMKELQDDCGTFGQISHPLDPAAMSSIPVGHVYELKSRKDFEEDIMATLREKKVSLLGLYGMGGVGKTTMAKKIMTRGREEGLFDEIVIVVVSQPIDMLRIQKEMAELLGLKFEVDGLLARAHLLRGRLMNNKKRILIILDDLWKGLDLEELGIPEGCTILLTSRDMDVFRAMNVDKTFLVETLDEVEAWCLFKEKVGACVNVDDQSLFPTAQEIVRECQGLPIAIVTVGVALKDKMDISIWKDALHDLRSCNPQDIPDFLAQVYNPLKLSYDLLSSKHAKSIFLLCCLFPEDHDILISDLCLYAWGLCIFKGIKRSLQDARNKMQTLVEMLKSRSLLLDGHYERCVKMHDVVRDVGIFIAAKEGLTWAREESNNTTIDCSWISLFGSDKTTLPEESVVPNLRFLLIGEPSHNQERLSENLFESSRKLCVLSIRDYAGMRSLPYTIQVQKNIRTLTLYKCPSLEDITVVGELVSLEILHCQFCFKVKELPVEIGRLNQLKLLHISYCGGLSRIPAGVISNLIRLEELTLLYSFSEWELAVEEGKNAAVTELNFLSRLTTLKIHICNTSLAAQQIHLPNLVEFDITFGNYWGRQSGCGRQMTLDFERDVIVGEWIHQLLRSTEYLFLEGEGSSKFLPLLTQFQSLKELYIHNVKFPRTEAVFGKLEVLEVRNCDNTKNLFASSIAGNLVNLRELVIESCGEMVKVIEDKDDNEVERSPFNSLERLELKNLPKLKDFCDRGCALQSLPSLKQVFISKCPNMETFSRGNFTSYSFQDLKSIRIESCIMLQQVLLWNEGEGGTNINRFITFPKLDKLFLCDLPRLTSLCKGIQRIEFPLLTEMDIKNCPNMKNPVSTAENDVDDSLHLFCKSKIAFDKLVVLKIYALDKMKSLFSISIEGNLVNLKELIIKGCGEIVKVIEDKDDNKVERSPFINLEKLELENLPKLENFSEWECALLFPSLIQVFISECPLMERFSRGSSTSPNSSDSFKDLKSIRIESCLMLEQVISWNEEEGGKDIHRRITFPKLGELVLCDLPRLTSLCKGIQSIEFPLLAYMEIKNCPNTKNLVSTAENYKNCPGALNCDVNDSLHFFCKSEAAFGMLKVIIIEGYDNIRSEKSLSIWCDQIPFCLFSGLEALTVNKCGNIKSLFSPSIAGKLFNLIVLRIQSCGEMVKVIEGDEDKSSPFIKLKTLRLEELPKLEVFCDWRCALQLPSLTSVVISECPQMEKTSLLKYISRGEWISDYTKDSNDALIAVRRDS